MLLDNKGGEQLQVVAKEVKKDVKNATQADRGAYQQVCKDQWTPIWINTGILAAKVLRTGKDQGKVARVLIDTQVSHEFQWP